MEPLLAAVVRLMPKKAWVCVTVCMPKLVIEHPGDDAREAAGQGEEGIADGEDHERARGDSLQRDAIEQGGKEDEDKAADFTDGGDVAELRTREVEHLAK